MSKVYGFIGVIGSGKSFTANNYMQKSTNAGRKVIMVDFSDAIREFVRFIIAGTGGTVNILSKEYSIWKKLENKIYLPEKDKFNLDILNSKSVSGRELLQRVGEGLKQFAGDDIWAKTATKRVLDFFSGMPKNEISKCDVIFGSLRFLYEAEELFKIASKMEKEVEIIFCDYHSDVYEINNHESEKLAQRLIDAGCKNGDNVTEIIKSYINNGTNK